MLTKSARDTPWRERAICPTAASFACLCEDSEQACVDVPQRNEAQEVHRKVGQAGHEHGGRRIDEPRDLLRVSLCPRNRLCHHGHGEAEFHDFANEENLQPTRSSLRSALPRSLLSMRHSLACVRTADELTFSLSTPTHTQQHARPRARSIYRTSTHSLAAPR